MNITHAAKYKLSAAEREKKLRKFTDVSDPEDLRGELACARLLAQEKFGARQYRNGKLDSQYHW